MALSLPLYLLGYLAPDPRVSLICLTLAGIFLFAMCVPEAPVHAGAVAATPATAKPKTKGVTVISFDKKLAPVVAGIVAVAPAKKTGTQLSFPVSKVQGNGVEHKGAIKVGATEVSNPIIIIKSVPPPFLGSEWSSVVCSSDLAGLIIEPGEPTISQ